MLAAIEGTLYVALADYIERAKARVARPLILRITISGAFVALNCENEPHGFGTG